MTANEPLPSLPVPGLVWGAYPERAAQSRAPWWLASLEAALPGWRSREGERYVRRLHDAVAAANARGGGKFSVRLAALRQSLARRKLSEALIVESFALIDAACQRELGLRPYDAQFAAARLMLEGRIAEMATGEGKTVAALFAAATAALAGVPVHVITANDYLAARDALTLRKLYAALGLRVGAVTHALPAEQRREPYRCDVTYCTAKDSSSTIFAMASRGKADGGELERRAARLAGAPRRRSGRRCCAGFAWQSSTRPIAFSSTKRAFPSFCHRRSITPASAAFTSMRCVLPGPFTRRGTTV